MQYPKSYKIAVNAAIPYQEFKQNPYAVLCTTSLGGHLSWFENNGGRWFAKPVSIFGIHESKRESQQSQACQFLQRLAKDVDFEKLRKNSMAPTNGDVDKDHAVSFSPMRRKLQYNWRTRSSAAQQNRSYLPSDSSLASKTPFVDDDVYRLRRAIRCHLSGTWMCISFGYANETFLRAALISVDTLALSDEGLRSSTAL